MGRQKSLGELEREVMEFLWEHGPATADSIRTAIGIKRALTDSTIRTVLRRLEAKHYVQHRTEGRQFLYSSAREPRRVAAPSSSRSAADRAESSASHAARSSRCSADIDPRSAYTPWASRIRTPLSWSRNRCARSARPDGPGRR